MVAVHFDPAHVCDLGERIPIVVRIHLAPGLALAVTVVPVDQAG